MKLRIEFSRNTELVPFTYMTNLNGYLHKILGANNQYHNDISLYSTSFLHNGKITKNKKGLNFPRGAVWYVSSPNNDFILKFINNVYKNQTFAFGMEVVSVNVVDSELVNRGEYYLFQTKSPILLKERNHVTKKNEYYTFNDDESKTSEIMKRVILKKAQKHGLNIHEDDFNISFNQRFENKKIKWIKIKSINNKTSMCPIFVKTKRKDVAEFIHSVGVGHSTGSGFGFLY